MEWGLRPTQILLMVDILELVGFVGHALAIH